ncbi:MAG: RluA family pseudouridine synthase [Hyphomicrobiaceae bacterium]
MSPASHDEGTEAEGGRDGLAGPAGRSATAAPADAGLRLDRFLAQRLPDLSRSRIQALVRSGEVAGPAGTIEDPGYRVKPGESFTISLPPAVAATPAPEAIPLAVVHEDRHLIVIDKPAGLVVHPAAGHAAGTLVNALIAHCGDSLSGIGGVRRPGIVHRLDKDTSGLLVAAKTDRAHQGLSEQFAAHGEDGRLERAYLAVVFGAPERRVGRIEAALGRKASNRTRIAVVREGGRPAATRYEVVETFEGPEGKALASLVRLTLETGRTHQIRVHMTSIGHPLLGDPTYATGFAASARRLPAGVRTALDALGRQALHAAVLGFEHPVTGRAMHFESALPADIADLVAAVRTAG